jgi:hypothetical protein
MFVVSVLDNGDERNFVATDVYVEANCIVFAVSGRTLRYGVADLLDVVPVERESDRSPRWASQRSARVN